MDQYTKIIPYLLFLFFAAIGVTANFLFSTPDKDITKARIIRELFGAIWISFGAYFLLKEFTTLSNMSIYFFCSIVGFINSKIIAFVGHDLIEAITKGVVRKIKNISEKDGNSAEQDNESNDNPKTE